MIKNSKLLGSTIKFEQIFYGLFNIDRIILVNLRQIMG
ncbi:hypothetical protein GARC_5078 [Paraglaciecola arctica BSs20135]|uniref:Uncharacterized protein n=1 Tax=Paraglaciecola arctica BSs20135 TaxID=493475 RepID=K6YZ31_9ALTE|nr:hypothetical protein GARC_5078 [Paraglaciecola arctica BSs20135]